MEGRRVSDSASEYSELALPNDANGLGNLLGGKIMHLVDLAGAIAAMKVGKAGERRCGQEQRAGHEFIWTL